MSAEKTHILAQHPPKPGLRRQLWLGVLLLIVPPLSVLTAFGIAPGSTLTDGEPVIVREALELPDLAPVPVTAPSRFVAQERVMRGDTVAAVLERLGVRDS